MRKIVNSMSAEMEIGSPMASLYLLGNPDHYASHKYVTFPWRPYVQFVRTLATGRIWKASDDEEHVPIGRLDGKYVPASGVDDYRYRPAIYSVLPCSSGFNAREKKTISPREGRI
ncbi:hypothetical protein B0H13DRAFT_1666961 [Mycena leptocephala]|nr:hypothetical protein B0H13DRAFT_1666961 [Mycena leptocephala]